MEPTSHPQANQAGSPFGPAHDHAGSSREADVPLIPRLGEQPTQQLPPVIGSIGPDEEEPGNQTVLEGSDAEAYAALKARRAERRKKKLMRRGIAIGAVAAVLAIGALAVSALAPKPDEGAGVVTDFALRGEYSTTIDASGTLEPLSGTVIAPETGGTIAEVRVAAGQAVSKGDVLMVIKNDELDRGVAEAQRALKTAKAELAAAKRGQDAPNENGGEDAVVSQEAIDAAALNVEAAQAAYDTAVAAAAQRTVTSPITGNVVTTNAKVGAPTTGSLENGQPLMQIADLTQMKVTIQVGEEDIAKVALDQQASISFPAFEDLVLTGKVTAIASTASGSSVAGMYGPGDAVQFAVDVIIENPDPRLKPGMTASVQITTEHLDDVVMVPAIALMSDDGATYYVIVEKDPQTAEHERVDVEVVAQNDDFAVIGKPRDASAQSNPEMAVSPLAGDEVLVISGAALDAGAQSDPSGNAGVDMDMAV